jgi:pimeloyl-ACP methyl ester carboxylesterase
MASKRGRAVALPASFPPVFVQRLLWGILVIAVVLLLVLVGAGAFLTYRITTTHNEIEDVTPASYLLTSYESVNFIDASGGEHPGWLLLGLRGAPTIILCPGYNSNRSELLSLGTVLQANHFNVYLFNFDGPGSKDRVSNLGVRESSILDAAIDRVTKLSIVNSHRVGLYGVTLGGYAALIASERNPAVEALVVDNGYERPRQLFDAQLDQLLGGAGGLFRLLSQAEFRLWTFRAARPHLLAGLSKLAGKPKLFLAADDAPTLKKATQDLYKRSPEPKRMLVLPHTRTNLSTGFEKKTYEDQVLNFFLQSLPLRTD